MKVRPILNWADCGFLCNCMYCDRGAWFNQAILFAVQGGGETKHCCKNIFDKWITAWKNLRKFIDNGLSKKHMKLQKKQRRNFFWKNAKKTLQTWHFSVLLKSCERTQYIFVCILQQKSTAVMREVAAGEQVISAELVAIKEWGRLDAE